MPARKQLTDDRPGVIGLMSGFQHIRQGNFRLGVSGREVYSPPCVGECKLDLSRILIQLREELMCLGIRRIERDSALKVLSRRLDLSAMPQCEADAAMMFRDIRLQF